ncbi:hypothetical protein [Burkholderia gladioli]|uniref:hypothetical protein n=1 Tax=Burkholderia gladioli TaxID=28095 RepID=UPI001364B267|nr:hypothetical protein [Burkholderia gladioli]KAF1064568.1 hypothetical protein LvStA_03233 [Burkholderia gladioli]
MSRIRKMLMGAALVTTTVFAATSAMAQAGGGGAAGGAGAAAARPLVVPAAVRLAVVEWVAARKAPIPAARRAVPTRRRPRRVMVRPVA